MALRIGGGGGSGFEFQWPYVPPPSCLVSASAPLPVSPPPALLAYLGQLWGTRLPSTGCSWSADLGLTQVHGALWSSVGPPAHPQGTDVPLTRGFYSQHLLPASQKERTLKVPVRRPVPVPSLETEKLFIVYV